jgi:hypothetical protein
LQRAALQRAAVRRSIRRERGGAEDGGLVWCGAARRMAQQLDVL